MRSLTKPLNGPMQMAMVMVTIHSESLQMLAQPFEIPQALTELDAQTQMATVTPTLMLHGRSPMVPTLVSPVRVILRWTEPVVLMQTVTATRTHLVIGKSATELMLILMTHCVGLRMLHQPMALLHPRR
jgi:hypothetical protein